MKEAINKIKGARASKDFGNYANYFLLTNGTIRCYDGCMSASAICKEIDGIKRLVPGDEIEKLIGRLDGAISITEDERSITIKAGRMRGRIQTLEPDQVLIPAPEAEFKTPPPTLVDAMRTARPFIADVAAQPWGTALCVRYEAVMATNNISLIEVAVPGLVTDQESDILLPFASVDFVLKVDSYLTGVIWEQNYAAFLWADGTWMRTQLIGGNFPPNIVNLLTQVQPQQPLKLTPDWRAAYRAVAEISENIVTFEAARIIGGAGKSSVDHVVDDIGLSKPVYFNPKFATPVVAAATAWDLEAFPKPIPFVADGVRGLLVGRQP